MDMSKNEAVQNHEAAKAHYNTLVSQTIRDEAAIAEALRQHRLTRSEVEKFAIATMAEGFRWNR